MAVHIAAPDRTALRLQLAGRVQGLGVRPAIARLAQRLDLTGSVRNTLRGLEIEIEGSPEDVASFPVQLPAALPAGCVVCEQRAAPIPVAARAVFEIERDNADGPLTTLVPPDTSLCSECLAESQDRADRRFGYPLISCAACGPRYSVIRRMPYEREDTSLAEFPLCDGCADEYTSPDDHRFHAQTTACSACGPNVWAVSAAGQTIGVRDEADRSADHARPGIAAVRDRWLPAAVRCGRRAGHSICGCKSCPVKPLAVLVSSLAAANDCNFRPPSEAIANSANPIVLLRRRHSDALAPSIHPGLNTVGVILPTTALHDQLARGFGRPLVCTSGNREGDPLEYEPAAAERNLAGIADLWLHHDRPTERPIDDSVVRVIAGRMVTIRLARGLAPLSLELPAGRPLVALGGHQKAALAWCNGTQCVLGPHIGDLETLGARERFLQQLDGVQQLYRFTPQGFAHDRHPGYFTSRWAAEGRLPRQEILHHHAHVAAGMLEHGFFDEPVLGVTFDGTGLGADGDVWGGEFLLAHSLTRMERIAHLRPFVLSGGEIAIREPWRVAVSLVRQSVGDEAVLELGIGAIGRDRVASLLPLLERSRLNVVSTSAGRLFDAAACLILGIGDAHFDGEPAMRLEDAADLADQVRYPFPLTEDSPQQLDWRPLFAAIVSDRRMRAPPGAMSMRFHRALAAGIAAVVRRHPGLPVVLGGGVFQNRLLTELVVAGLGGTRRLCLPGT
ncbi:MAG: carbamoyltransferase HypF, partial [Planctomycetaceae bacterium]